MAKATIIYPNRSRVNPERDLVDIEVRYGGQRFFGVVTTPEYVRDCMASMRGTRENARGSYFCAKGLVLVTAITPEVVQRTVDDLVKTRDLEKYFHQ